MLPRVEKTNSAKMTSMPTKSKPMLFPIPEYFKINQRETMRSTCPTIPRMTVELALSGFHLARPTQINGHSKGYKHNNAYNESTNIKARDRGNTVQAIKIKPAA